VSKVAPNYEIVNGSLAVNSDDGHRRLLRPLDRDVIAILQLPNSDDCIVLSDYRNHGVGALINLSCVRPDGLLVWCIEPPDSRNDEFTSIRLVDGKLHAFASSGFSFVIEPRNGKVLRRTFVK
jgi:hypothetical protein